MSNQQISDFKTLPRAAFIMKYNLSEESLVALEEEFGRILRMCIADAKWSKEKGEDAGPKSPENLPHRIPPCQRALSPSDGNGDRK